MLLKVFLHLIIQFTFKKYIFVEALFKQVQTFNSYMCAFEKFLIVLVD